MVNIEQWKLALRILKGELDDQLDELIQQRLERLAQEEDEEEE